MRMVINLKGQNKRTLFRRMIKYKMSLRNKKIR